MKITSISHNAAVRIAMSMYLGEQCICGYKFNKIKELDNVVWHPHKTGRISHKECFEKQPTIKVKQ